MLNPFKIQDRFSVIQMLVGGHITYHADDDIIYHDEQTPPTEKEITDKMAELQADRKTASPRISASPESLMNAVKAGKLTLDQLKEAIAGLEG